MSRPYSRPSASVGRVALALLALAAVPAPDAVAQPAPGAVPGTPARPQAPAAAAPSPAQAPTQAPVPAEPQRTTASFGDWVLRCERPAQAAQSCEAAQTVVTAQGQPVAQVAVGRPARGEPMRLTVLVPPSVTFAAPARLAAAEPGDGVTADLVWRRCLPGGCLADAVLGDELISRLRARTEPLRITFGDGAGREGALPVSLRGLPQALDALAKEDGR